MADNGKGAVVQGMQRWHGAAAADPDQAGGEELGRQLAGQVETGIVPGQRENRSIYCFYFIFNNRINSKLITL